MAGSLPRRMPGWQFILADLALILFLLTLTGLPVDGVTDGGMDKGTRAGLVNAPLGRAAARSETRSNPAGAPPDPAPDPAIAPAQALYRPVAGGPSLAEWLADQPHDPRATLTIFARYPRGEEHTAWRAAEALLHDSAASGLAIRTIIAAGRERDLYASLAYDAPLPAPP